VKKVRDGTELLVLPICTVYTATAATSIRTWPLGCRSGAEQFRSSRGGEPAPALRRRAALGGDPQRPRHDAGPGLGANGVCPYTMVEVVCVEDYETDVSNLCAALTKGIEKVISHDRDPRVRGLPPSSPRSSEDRSWPRSCHHMTHPPQNPSSKYPRPDLAALRRAPRRQSKSSSSPDAATPFALPIRPATRLRSLAHQLQRRRTARFRGENLPPATFMPRKTCLDLCQAMQDFRATPVLTFDKETKGAIRPRTPR